MTVVLGMCVCVSDKVITVHSHFNVALLRFLFDL